MMRNCYENDELEYEREREIRNLMNNPEELERRERMSEGCDYEAEEASSRLFWRERMY